jgi:hypothetical protein
MINVRTTIQSGLDDSLAVRARDQHRPGNLKIKTPEFLEPKNIRDRLMSESTSKKGQIFSSLSVIYRIIGQQIYGMSPSINRLQ